MRRLAEATNKVVESAFVRERFEALGVAVEPPERRTTRIYLEEPAARDRAAAAVMSRPNGLSAE